jgi:hypothetical protein
MSSVGATLRGCPALGQAHRPAPTDQKIFDFQESKVLMCIAPLGSDLFKEGSYACLLTEIVREVRLCEDSRFYTF